MKTTGFRIKKENYTAVADFMIASMERDLEDFTKVFKTIDEDFLSDFKNANIALKNAAPNFATKQEQVKSTKNLYHLADKYIDKLVLLKAYAKRSDIDTPIIQETIIALRRRNIEKAVKNTRELLPFITLYKDKIKDMPSNFLEDIPTLIEEMEAKATQQNILISQGKRENKEMQPLYIDLYKYIREIADVGKLVYKKDIKKDDYTISKIIKRLEVANQKKKEDE